MLVRLLTDLLRSRDVTYAPGSGDPTAAGFVQVIRATVPDRARFEAVEESLGPAFVAHRPDFLAGYRVWLSDSELVAVDFFSSEAEARAGEAKEMPDELRRGFADWMASLEDVEWLNLPDPNVSA